MAAVCYRRDGNRSLEFLLVRTDGGKWTFPKGRIDPAHGARKCAQLEALEEAGAYGFIAEQPFHTFLYAKGVFWKAGSMQEFPVVAYLLEVTHLAAPHQEFRDPTWCSPKQTTELLSQGREDKYRREFERVVAAALEAIGGRKNGNRLLRFSNL